jgi:hypothetical protein
MEPITVATSFASIVGLLSIFKSEGKSREGDTLEDFIEWLRRREHEQVVDLILKNTQLSRSLGEIVQVQHEQILARLAELDAVLADVASHVAVFQSLADAVRIQSHLSDQSVSILRQLNDAHASKFVELPGGRRETIFEMLDGIRGRIRVTEPRFVDSDLSKLCELGLLLPSFGSNGGRIFTITRSGSTVGGKAEEE